MKKPFSLGQASRRWWLLLAALLVASVATYVRRASPPPAEPARLSGKTMGTTWSVLLDGPREATVLEATRRDVEAVLASVNASMSTYDPTSELSRFNARELTTPLEVSAPLAQVLRDAQAVSVASGGAFDVTVGPLVEAWGFGARGRPKRVPSDDEVAALLESVGAHRLSVDGGLVAKAHPKLQVDLSAIAKGYAVDQVSAALLARGERNHLVDIGGELTARGVNALGEPFRVGVEAPDPQQRRVLHTIALTDRSIASSGNYRNFYEVGGRRYAHTIDPSTGRPVQHPLVAVSVLDQRCAIADAWATALMAAGPQRAWALVERHRLDAMLLVERPDGGIEERSTAGFEAALLRGR